MPSVKFMLRCKNKLMRAGRLEQAAALAVKIRAAIKQFNSAELSRVDVIADLRSLGLEKIACGSGFPPVSNFIMRV